ncbi:MAG: hypothetical protein IPK96_02830 [Flammeovirgaceae bacterium]|nr:hypothetical protein [Flammeovirgaceae bacterium]
MKPLSLIFFFAILLGLRMQGVSQNIFHNGLIIKESGDTLKGYLKLQGNKIAPTGVLFKETDKSIEVAFTIEDFESVILNDYRYYKSIIINNERVLAQFLVQGKANLYSWDDKFFLEKENEVYPLIIEEIEVKADYIHQKKSYVGVLKFVLSDCPEVQELIDQSRLAESSLSEIIEKYNHCVNVKPLVYKEMIPTFRFRVSPLVGLSYNNLNASVSDQYKFIFGYYEEADFSQFGFSPGVGMQFSTPRVTDQFSIYIELRYLRASSNEKIVFEGPTYDTFDVSLSYSYLFVPIMFQYDIPISIKNAIYFRLGLIKTFSLTNNLTVTRSQSNYPNAPPVSENDRFDFYSNQTGFAFGLGFQRKYSKKNIVFIESRFENPGPIINNTTIGLASNVYSLITGITF